MKKSDRKQIILIVSILVVLSALIFYMTQYKTSNGDNSNVSHTPKITIEPTASPESTIVPTVEPTSTPEVEVTVEPTIDLVETPIIKNDGDHNFSDLIHEEIMKCNFSSIMGEYKNPKGEITILDNNVKCDPSSEVVYDEKSKEYWLKMTYDDGGDQLNIYNVGVEVHTYVNGNYEAIETDITKIRIYYGQDYPLNETYIYTKE